MKIKSLNNEIIAIWSRMIWHLLSMIYSSLDLRVQKREHVISACSITDSIKSSVHICDKEAKNIWDAIRNSEVLPLTIDMKHKQIKWYFDDRGAINNQVIIILSIRLGIQIVSANYLLCIAMIH